MKRHDWIAILDFGSQYTQLIARRVREQHVYSEIVRHDMPAAKLKQRQPSGIILSGGPKSVFAPQAPACDPVIFKLGIPILGICYGMQLMAKTLGGAVKPGLAREYGNARIAVTDARALFHGLPPHLDVWMSHGDQVLKMPSGFRVLAKTHTCPVAAMADQRRKMYGIQFHPEVVHTRHGTAILRRFIFNVCKCREDWRMEQFIAESILAIRRKVGKSHVVCGLSGGVDSAVVAMLLHKAIGDQLHCIFVDNGLLRHGEARQVEETFIKAFGIDLHVAHAQNQFLSDLKGVLDPEKKRKAIGKRFIDIFAEEARRLGEAPRGKPRGIFAEPCEATAAILSSIAASATEDPSCGKPQGFLAKKGDIRFLAQGTLYPDVIESASPLGGPSATIKSHHNVGGLPADLKFQLIEPLRELFKDEVRALGRELGMPTAIINRQPFPGPGLAVRIIGEVTQERVTLLQQADLRVQEEIAAYDKGHTIWQAFAVLLPVKSVGVMGDGRTYENTVVVRAVTSQDGMTADWARLPHELLARLSNRIINEVRGVNRVVYDISSKPPATIEWE